MLMWQGGNPVDDLTRSMQEFQNAVNTLVGWLPAVIVIGVVAVIGLTLLRSLIRRG